MLNETARVVRFHKLGGPEVLMVENVPLPEPGPGEVRLRVHAFGLNRSEILFRLGRYWRRPQFPSRIGYEASGIVEAVGPGVDKSMIGRPYSSVPSFNMSLYGVYGEIAILPAFALAPFPEQLTFIEATAIWMPYMTAYGALVLLSNLVEGDYVIITAASSSVGLAAIEVVQDQGAISIATTRTQAKKEQLLAYGADYVIVTEEEDLPERVRQITGERGARVVFDAIAGRGTRALAEATAADGTIFIHGALSLEETPFPIISGLGKALTMRGFNLARIVGVPELRAEAERYIYERLQHGIFKPKIARTFPLEQIVEAHYFMESNQQIGKIVVTVNETDASLPGIF